MSLISTKSQSSHCVTVVLLHGPEKLLKGSVTIRPFSSSRLKSIYVSCLTLAILIKFFNHEVKQTSRFWDSGLYLFNIMLRIKIFMSVRAYLCTKNI